MIGLWIAAFILIAFSLRMRAPRPLPQGRRMRPTRAPGGRAAG
jgi:hypothetical protein